MEFNNIYYKKKVLITGHTGFKGTWLSIWLKRLGADVYGISDVIPTKPSNFEVTGIENIISHNFINILDYDNMKEAISKIEPKFVFHLAAQAIVAESYIDPKNTFEVNVIGTSNLLNIIREINLDCNVIIITSDKCYENVEWAWGYREVDRLGGKDPYSASKAAAELVFNSYYHSFFNKKNCKVKLVSARAGNVIGGGDWASNRIIPDAVRAWSNSEKLVIRSPKATRPWQHVLEPLSGYLLLGQLLQEGSSISGESYNFGPLSDSNFSVEKLLSEMSGFLQNFKWESMEIDTFFKEAGLLKLSCDKALADLNWKPNLNFTETVSFVTSWYTEYYENQSRTMFDYSSKQITEFVSIAKNKKISWAQ